MTGLDPPSAAGTPGLFTIPQTLLYVYLGAVGKAALLGESGGVNLGIMMAGGLTFLGVVLLITRRVRESMRELQRQSAQPFSP